MKKTISICIAVAVAACAAGRFAEARPVPEVLLFQSALYDDGGNPIADGPVDLILRIVDDAGRVLYEERQTPDAVRGQVSVLVGNGLTSMGAPTGGVPRSVLDPASLRYIEAEAAGQPPTAPMEIASVPYSLYAGEADSVAEGGVGYEALKVGVVEKLAEALSDSVVGENEVIVRGDLPTLYRESSAAASIGVEPAFVYSAADDLQGVLADFDAAIKARDTRISTEVAARTQGDQTLSVAISAEANARQGADAALSQRMDSIDAAVTSPPRPQYHPNAWGRIVACQNVPVVASLANAGAASLGPNQCRIDFVQPMADADYAIITSPYASVASREAGGFTVNCGSLPNCGFEFLAVGR